MKIGLVTSVCAVAILLSGCWDYMPLEQKFIVNAIGIDISKRDPNRILVTAMGTTYHKANEVLTAEGNSVRDAIRGIRDRMDKHIALSHVQTVLFSEQLVQKGITPYLDIFYRDPQLRSDAMMLVVKGDIHDFLDPEKKAYPINGKFIQSIVANSETKIGEHSYDIQSTIFAIENNAAHFSLPLLSFEQEQKVIRFVGLALFDDGLMVGELNERQMIGFLMLNGFLESAVYTSGMVRVGEPTAKAVTLRLFGPKRKIEWKMENGQPKMKIDFNFKDEVLEINPWYQQKMNVEQFELLESQVERDIEKLLDQVLYIVQKQHRLELFDIRNMARVKWAGHYDKKRWNEQFSKIPIEINVNIQIERTGILY